MTYFECPICLDNIKYASIGTCTHHFCYFCLFKHCKTSNLCPICKTEINDFRIDREFDQLVNGESLPSFKYTNEITINDINDLYSYILTNINKKYKTKIKITTILKV